MKKKVKKQRAWLWVVAPFLFVIVGVGVFFGLKYLLQNNQPETAVNIDIEEKTPEDSEPEETQSPTEGAAEEAVPAAEVAAIGPSPFAGMAQNENGTNSTSTYNAIAHEIDGIKYVYYKTMVWGDVVADFEDFRLNVAETLGDERGWMRMGLRFVEVTDGQDLNIILSNPWNLEGYNGYCSAELSCTSGLNEVIINDVRWREGTDATAQGGMSIRDYQHMVVNHEMGHWLGHYSHIEACDVDGGTAPIMLQQSTGLRNCGAFNPWPLDDELWTLR